MVSVIICAGKLNTDFRECIDSVLKQTYEDFEVILVAGEDGLGVFETEAKKDPRIRVVNTNAKLPVGTMRNIGLNEAKGEYFCFVDADDLFYSDTSLERMIRSLSVENGDVLITNYIRRRGDEDIPAHSHGYTERDDVLSVDFRFRGFFSIGHLGYVWGKLYRTEFVRENEIHFPDTVYGEDKTFNLCLYAARPDFVFSDQITYVYRVNKEGLSFQYKEDYKEIWEKDAIFFDRYLEQQKDSERFKDLSGFLMLFALIFHIRQEYDFGKNAKERVKVVEGYTTDDYVRQKVELLLSNKIGDQIEDFSYRMGIDNLSRWIIKGKNDSIAFGLDKLFALSVDKKRSAVGREL